jgi:hypothetical protein
VLVYTLFALIQNISRLKHILGYSSFVPPGARTLWQQMRQDAVPGSEAAGLSMASPSQWRSFVGQILEVGLLLVMTNSYSYGFSMAHRNSEFSHEKWWIFP